MPVDGTLVHSPPVRRHPGFAGGGKLGLLSAAQLAPAATARWRSHRSYMDWPPFSLLGPLQGTLDVLKVNRRKLLQADTFLGGED